MFAGALFTTAKKWKEGKCPATNEWIPAIQQMLKEIL